MVCLEDWLPTETMQAIAAENNLSETAFYLEDGGEYGLRWFTPEVEVDLCGHATLATAHVLFNELGVEKEVLRFHTRSGVLEVSQDDQGIRMDFPAYHLEAGRLPGPIAEALGGEPLEAYMANFRIFVYRSEAEVRALQPDFPALMAASAEPVIATAAGDEVDFVSRFFGPQVGIDEDPVTGSAHCALVPLWAEKLGKQKLSAWQVSARKGELSCELLAGRVAMQGYGLTFLRGQIEVEVSAEESADESFDE